MGLAVFSVIAIAAIAVGIAAQLLRPKGSFTWVLIAAAAAFGAYFFSETLPTSSLFEAVKSWGPQVDGFYVLPGLVGALVIGAFGYLGTPATSPNVSLR